MISDLAIPRSKAYMMGEGLTVGGYLQRQREEKRIPLETVAGVTKITLANLQALERDEFHRLPGEIFTRGFLRSYAKFIHLDPEEVVAAYKHQMEAAKKQDKFEHLAPAPSNPFLKKTLHQLKDFASTMMGASPAYSPGKVVLPPKE